MFSYSLYLDVWQIHAHGRQIDHRCLFEPESAHRIYPKRSSATDSIKLGMAHFQTSFYTTAQQSASHHFS
jgi:hypothetical protein